MSSAPPVPTAAPLAFVLPAGSERPSGGNLYNDALLAALGGLVPLRKLTLAECRTAVEQGAPGLYFLDSLDLDAAEVADARQAGQHFGLVVHHLPSFELERPDAAALAEEASKLAKFEVLLCTSDVTRELLERRGLEPARLLTVLPAPPAVRVSPGRYEPPLRALIVANLIARKAVLPWLELLDARRDPAPFTLVIVGRDDIEPAYASACHAVVSRSPYLGARVRLEPALPHERMLERYAAADVLLSTAAFETFGMAVQEALSHGVPVLVRDGGYVARQVRDGVNGVVAPDLGTLVATFLELAADPLRIRALAAGAQGTRPDTSYDWQAAAQSLLRQLGR
jgi:glycosyltransferase involved in cell wall biosynthesis